MTEPRIFTEEEADQHNALYKRAMSLIRSRIIIDGESRSATPSWFARRRLRQGIALFQEALRMNPDSWQNRFWIGKALQRLGDHNEAVTWFAEALRIEPDNAVIALEAANEALDLGQYEFAISLLRPAAQANPSHAVLQHNLGVAFLLSQRPREAVEAFNKSAALAVDPNTARLLDIAERVSRGERACPAYMADLRRGA
jgi:tetratricopeptide (TPR) repeat protein